MIIKQQICCVTFLFEQTTKYDFPNQQKDTVIVFNFSFIFKKFYKNLEQFITADLGKVSKHHQ